MAKSMDRGPPSRKNTKRKSLVSLPSETFTLGQSFVSYRAKERHPVEKLINFITLFINQLKVPGPQLTKLEQMTVEVIAESRDPELVRIAKDFGWTGTRFISGESSSFDAEFYLRALSNYYLKLEAEGSGMDLQTLLPSGESLNVVKLYCPDVLINYFTINYVHDLEPKSFTFQGACMLADISGFSRFSGKMCSKGIEGLDFLREETNNVLGVFIKTVKEFGGDVMAFAGDALICVFGENSRPSVTPNRSADGVIRKTSNHMIDFDRLREGGIEHCCFSAIQCACALREFKTDYLFTHLGVSCGELSVGLLGGFSNEWIYLLNGECIVQLADCIHDAEKGQAAATQECYSNALKWIGQLKADGVEALITTEKASHDNNILVEEVLFKDREEDEPAPAGKMESVYGSVESNAAANTLRLIGSFVPRPVYNALMTESREVMGELREVTTLFLNLESYCPVKHRDPMTLQPFFRMCQTVLHETGGFLRQFLVDDKGCVFIAMWGTPCYAYSNNCSRALYCAAQIHQLCAEAGEHEVSIGITTGIVYCGSIGSSLRKDYAGIGTDVNMAARLMCKADKQIYVDPATYENLNQTNKEMLMALSEPLILKGALSPIPAYVYCSKELPKMLTEDTLTGSHQVSLRRSVRKLMVQQLDNFSNVNSTPGADPSALKNFFTVLLGVHGTGKSLAAQYFKYIATKRNVKCIYINSTVEMKGIPYGVMKQLFLELVGKDNFATRDQQEAVIDKLIEESLSQETSEERDIAFICLMRILSNMSNESEAVRRRMDRARSKSDESQVERKTSGVSLTVDGLQQQQQQQQQQQPTIRDIAHLQLEIDDSAVEYVDDNKSVVSSAAESDPPPMLVSSKVSSPSKKSVHMKPKTFCQVICHLLSSTPTAIIIESGEYCDELTWTELRNLQNTHINVVILVTLLCEHRKRTTRQRNSKSRRGSLKPGDGTAEAVRNATTAGSPRRGLNNLAKQASLIMGFASAASSAEQQPKRRSGSNSPRDSLNDSRNGSRTLNGSKNGRAEKNPSRLKSQITRNSPPPPPPDLRISSREESPRSTASPVISPATLMHVTPAPSYSAFNLPDMDSSTHSDRSSVTEDRRYRPCAGTSTSDAEIISIERENSNHSMSTLSTLMDPHTRDFAKKYGLTFLLPPSCVEIFEDPTTTIIELQSLTLEEVKELLGHTLHIKEIESDLVRTVFDVSSGNPFWCKTIAMSINELGLERIVEKMGESGGNALSNLILCRMEKMPLNHQLILKRASIIGQTFTLRLLQSIAEDVCDEDLQEMVRDFVLHGFVNYVEETAENGNCLCCFQNLLIARTLAELTPPSVAEPIHLKIAKFIETTYADNLHPYYLRLSHHYRKANQRSDAFKFTVKAANQSIYCGAFGDGLEQCRDAFHLAKKEKELLLLLHVLDAAIFELETIEHPMPINSSANVARQISKLLHSVLQDNTMAQNYKKLRKEVDAKARQHRMQKTYIPEQSLGFVVSIRESSHSGAALGASNSLREYDDTMDGCRGCCTMA